MKRLLCLTSSMLVLASVAFAQPPGGTPIGNVGNTGNGNMGNGVGNTGPGNMGNGPNPGAGNAGGNQVGPGGGGGGGNPGGGGGGNPPGGGGNPPGNTPPANQQAQQQQQRPTHKSHSALAGKIAVGCMFGAASGAIIGAATVGRSQQRQLTIKEATLAIAGGCPVFLPLYWLVPPDNKATYEIARRAWAFRNTERGRLMCEFNESGCMGPFTAAYHDGYKYGTVPKYLKDYR